MVVNDHEEYKALVRPSSVQDVNHLQYKRPHFRCLHCKLAWQEDLAKRDYSEGDAEKGMTYSNMLVKNGYSE